MVKSSSAPAGAPEDLSGSNETTIIMPSSQLSKVSSFPQTRAEMRRLKADELARAVSMSDLQQGYADEIDELFDE